MEPKAPKFLVPKGSPRIVPKGNLLSARWMFERARTGFPWRRPVFSLGADVVLDPFRGHTGVGLGGDSAHVGQAGLPPILIVNIIYWFAKSSALSLPTTPRCAGTYRNVTLFPFLGSGSRSRCGTGWVSVMNGGFFHTVLRIGYGYFMTMSVIKYIYPAACYLYAYDGRPESSYVLVRTSTRPMPNLRD